MYYTLDSKKEQIVDMMGLDKKIYGKGRRSNKAKPKKGSKGGKKKNTKTKDDAKVANEDEEDQEKNVKK